MIRSMTGFGWCEGKCDAGSVRVEVRTVNYKTFRFSPQLPDFLRYKEGAFEKIAGAYISRGNLYLNVDARLSEDIVGRMLDRKKMLSYIEAVRSAVHGEDIAVTADVAGLVDLPGVLEMESLPDDIREDMYVCVEGVLREAIESLDAMRKTEGEGLQKHLLKICGSAEEKTEALSDLIPEARRSCQERLHERVSELLADSGVSPDSEALSREVALIAERSDVAEEVERLGNHFEQFREALGSGERGIGKKLEFLTQEMHREANTLGSKLPSAELVHHALDIKADVHQLREQVMNVE